MKDISKYKDLIHVLPSIIDNTAKVEISPFPPKEQGRYDACIHCSKLNLTASLGVYDSLLDALNTTTSIIDQIKNNHGGKDNERR